MDKKCPECKAGAPEWMLTYGDLVTLLMCFFVLLFAMSTVDAAKFESLLVSFQGSSGILPGGTSLSDGKMPFNGMPEQAVSKNNSPSSESTAQLKNEVEKKLEEQNLDKEVEVSVEARGLIIRFPDNILYDSGSADLKQNSRKVLAAISNILKSKEFSNRVIRVEGHTDNVPISTVNFPSNWELSTTRATNVVKYFIRVGGVQPIRLTAAGYGEYHPIASNKTKEGKAKNRRVDIVILSTEEASKEPTASTGKQ